MVSHILLIIVIALNIIPSEADIFSVKSPEGDVSRYAIQTDGSWKEQAQGATFRILKDKLVLGDGKQESSMGLADLAQAFGYKVDTDWTSVLGVPLKRGDKLNLRRRTDGVDIEFVTEAKTTLLYEVRWEDTAKR
jgi:hypothetical protein